MGCPIFSESYDQELCMVGVEKKTCKPDDRDQLTVVAGADHLVPEHFSSLLSALLSLSTSLTLSTYSQSLHIDLL